MPVIRELPDNGAPITAAAGPQPKHQDHEKFMEDLLKTPLFMKTMPTEKDIEENETLAAIHSLIYDGTPDEIATNFKNQGNESFQGGPKGYKHAINYYTKGLEQKPEDRKLVATLYANRAAVNLELGNYRKVLNDCAAAMKVQPDNIKAYYRSAKALLALDKIPEALDCCDIGLHLDPSNVALKKEKEKCLKRKQVLDETEKRRAERQAQKEQEEQRLADAIKARRVKMVKSSENRGDDSDSETPDDRSPFVHPLQGDHQVRLDPETGSLIWPVVFLYPEYKQSDLIAGFNEEDTFGDHLQLMFGEERPSWDESGTYVAGKLEVLFEARPEEGPIKLLRVGNKLRLMDVLRHPDYQVVDGVCSFFVLPTGSSFAKSFRRKYKQPAKSSLV